MGRELFDESFANSLAAKLREIPPAPPKPSKLTKQDLVRRCEAEIRALFDRGYNVQQIADAMSDDGIDFSPNTLKNYLRLLKAERGEISPEPQKRRRRSTKRNTAKNVGVKHTAPQAKAAAATTTIAVEMIQEEPTEEAVQKQLEQGTFKAKKFSGNI